MLPVHRLIRNAARCLHDCVMDAPGAKPTIALAQAYLDWAEHFMLTGQDTEKAQTKLYIAHSLLKDLLHIYYIEFSAPTYETERLEAIVGLIEELLEYLSPATYDGVILEDEYIELTELPEFCE